MFIELTEITSNNKILVNIFNFDTILINAVGETTLKKSGEVCGEYVKETPEEIMQKIKEAQHV